MKRMIFYLLPIVLLLSACSKDTDNSGGTEVNSWTFTEGSKTYSGSFVFGHATLNTTPQSNNNTYTFAMLGTEKTSGYLFNIVLSLLDLNFTVKTYQSGVNSVDDHLNAFYYTQSPTSVDDIYKSSNLDPGPVMNYTITEYDAAQDIVTFTFSGQAQLANGSNVAITNGKVKVKIQR